MTSTSCHPIAELLVQYADGELPAADARRVADHLTGCADCRAELRLLRRSLGLARDVWQQSAARAPSPGQYRVRPGRRRIYAAACVAVCVAVLLITAGPWLFSGGESVSKVRPDGKGEELGPSQLADDVDDVDIEALIAREGRSARLAAAARFLGSQPGLEQYRKQAERYLAEAYRGTAAAGGASPPPPLPPTKEPES